MGWEMTTKLRMWALACRNSRGRLRIVKYGGEPAIWGERKEALYCQEDGDLVVPVIVQFAEELKQVQPRPRRAGRRRGEGR